jgi:membrane fusion protein, multidrug efflux system
MRLGFEGPTSEGIDKAEICVLKLLTSQSLIHRIPRSDTSIDFFFKETGMRPESHSFTGIHELNRLSAHMKSARTAIKWIALSSVIVLAACSKPAPAPEPVRAVKVMTVGQSAMEASSEYAGEVRARVESRLGFRVAGKIARRQAEVGQRVKAGQVLAQLDPQDYKLSADAARAQLAAATTNRDLAAADYKRFQTLKDQNFISGAELERRETTLKAAQAQLDQAQAQLANVGNQVGYTNLVADMSGVITAVEAEPGQVVSAGTPVVRIAQDGARDVVFNVPEDRAQLLPLGSEITIKRWASDETIKGRLREVAASADPLTRTYQAKIAIDAQSAPPLGSTVYVYPPSMTQGVAAIKLPTSAVFESNKQSTVWLLDKQAMTVKAQTIQIATADGNEAVVTSGLKAGDVVVVAGVHVLAPGQKVTLFQGKLSQDLKKNTLPALTQSAPPAIKTIAYQPSVAK